MTPDTITLKANSIYPVRVAGKFLSILSCTAALAVELDNGGRVGAVTGSQFGNGEGFSKVTFIETSGKDNTVSYTIADSPSPGRTIAVQAGASTFGGSNSDLYDFGPATITFPGVDAQGRARKVIYISNSGRATLGGVTTTAVLMVGTSKGFAAIIQPNSGPVAIETSETLFIGAYLADLSGGANHLIGAVFEIFYSKPLQTDQ